MIRSMIRKMNAIYDSCLFQRNLITFKISFSIDLEPVQINKVQKSVEKLHFWA